MGPFGLLLAGMLALGDDTVTVRWDPAPGAYAYRIYICTAGENQCWGSNFHRYWSLFDQRPEPDFTGQRPTIPMWLAVANVFAAKEVIRVGETVYIRPGPRYVER